MHSHKKQQSHLSAHRFYFLSFHFVCCYKKQSIMTMWGTTIGDKKTNKAPVSRDGTPLTEGTSCSGSSGGSGSSKSPHQAKTSTAVNWGRTIFIGCLAVLAALLGFSAHYFMSQSETKMAESQFITINERALTSAVGISYRKFLGSEAMASVIGNALPDADPWPFVYVPGYKEIVKSVVPTSLSKGLNFAPIVQPEEAEAWEEYAQDIYKKTFPEEEGMGVSSFGFGMWAKDKSLDTSDQRFHEISGETSWGSPNRILVPKMHHAFYNSPLLLFQTHYPKIHGTTIDGVIECSKIRALSDDPGSINCGSISEFAISNAEKGPGGLVVTPIYPRNNFTTVTGFIVGFLNWQEVLEDIFADGVHGVDCVISTPNQAYTWEIVDGSPVFRDEGDHHDLRYDKFGRSAVLASSDLGGLLPLNNFTQTYTLSIYPNEALYETYRTNNPRISTLVAVFAIVFTSFIFILYDFFVHRDINNKKNLLDAKRQFVRFVSHEVRTPLNSVCMGLELLQEEIAMSLGFASPVDMMAASEDARSEAAKQKGDAKGESLGWFSLAHEVEVGAQSSVDVLNDLLNYDKIESGTLNLEMTVVPIWDLIKNTLAEFQLPAASKKITVDFKLPWDKTDVEQPHPVLPKEVRDQKVVGDNVRITQVLRNLMSNAIKFLPEGGSLFVEAQWIDRECKQLDQTFAIKNKELLTVPRTGMLEVKVRDTGAGMSKEQLARLFQKGVQFNVNELQAGNGSGLGLYIAKGIVDQHGGSLTCSSEGIGKGTTFTMVIPLFHIPDKESTSSENEELEAALASDYKESPLHVLIVDDATSNRKLLNRLLKNHGHSCEECEDGHLAVQKVKDAQHSMNPFDMVLLDYEMPTMNGPTAAQEIRNLGINVFMVGITGNMMAEDVEYFISMGANAVLPKPFKMASLADLCAEYNVVGHQDSIRSLGAGMVRVTSGARLNMLGGVVDFGDSSRDVAMVLDLGDSSGAFAMDD